jgi:hypothetical protein
MGNKADIELRYSIYETLPVVQLIFAYDSELIRSLKAHTKVRWSNTLQEWYIPCSVFHPEKFKHDFGTDYYLHAKRDHATAILGSTKYRRTANGKIRPTGPFAKKDPDKEEKMQQANNGFSVSIY